MEKMVIGAWQSKRKTFVAALLYLTVLSLVFGTVLIEEKTLYPITYAGRSTDYLISNEELLNYINVGGVYADSGAADWVEIPIVSTAVWNVQHGEMPLWDMFNSLGMPIVDNNNGSTLAPFTWMLYLWNSEMAWNVMYILRIFFMMLFTYLFLDELGLKFRAAFIGGIIFGLSGYVMLYMNIFFMHVDAFLPLLMWFTLRYIKSGGLWHWVGCSLTVAAMCLGGNPQNLITCCFLSFAFYLFYVFTTSGYERKIKSIFLFLGCFISGVLLTMGYWLSFLTLYSNCYSYHGNAGLGVKTFTELIGLVIPRAYFTPMVRTSWMPYMGILTAAVILIHTEWGKKAQFHKEKIFFGVFFILFILKIVGFPLINWIGRLPVLNELSFTKYNSSMYFAVAVLAAMAICDMESNLNGLKKWIQCIFIVITAVGVNVVYHTGIIEKEIVFNKYIRSASIMLLFAAIVSIVCMMIPKKKFFLLFVEILLCMELISYPISYRQLFAPRSAAFTQPEFITELKSLQDNAYDRVFCVDKLLMGNLSAIYQVCNVGGISPTPEIHYWNFMNELVLNHTIDLQMVTTQSSIYDPNCKKILDMIGTKFFLADDERRIDDPSLVPVYENGRLTIYQNKDSFDKAYTVHGVILVSDEAESLETMKSRDLDFSQKAIIEGDSIYSLEELAENQKDIIDITEYKANSVTVKCQMAADGLLVLNDLYYPGWTVYVNGEKKDIFRTNDVVRGVFLQKGDNVVEFVYRPKAFLIGTGISVLYVVILAAGIIIYKKETEKCKRK